MKKPAKPCAIGSFAHGTAVTTAINKLHWGRRVKVIVCMLISARKNPKWFSIDVLR